MFFCYNFNNYPWFSSALPATDLKWCAALLHGATGSSGQVPDEQSEGASHVRRALLHAADGVSVLQEAPPRPVPPGPSVQGWAHQPGRNEPHASLTRLHAIWLCVVVFRLQVQLPQTLRTKGSEWLSWGNHWRWGKLSCFDFIFYFLFCRFG